MSAGKPVICSVSVKNTGSRSGAEVVQLYIGEKNATVLRPVKELKGFRKVMLNPGEVKTVDFEISAKALAYWDDVKHDWNTNPGPYNLFIGNSSRTKSQTILLEMK